MNARRTLGSWSRRMAGLVLLCATFMSPPLSAQSIQTIAGDGVQGYAGDGGPAINARINRVQGMAVDDIGNVYIADTDNHRIRRIDLGGTITTYAGTGAAGFSGDNGPALSAMFNRPRAMAVDAGRNLYVIDQGNNRIRRISSTGVVTTVAGSGAFGMAGDNGPATAAALGFPWGIAVDAAGNLYIGDTSNYRVRKVSTAGTITTIAGTGSDVPGGDNGPALSAAVWPFSVAVNGAGEIVFTDASNTIRKIGLDGIIRRHAGTGAIGYSGDGDLATLARLDSPDHVIFDAAGNVWFTDAFNHVVRRVDAGTNVITTVAGIGTSGFSGDGGPATAAQLTMPLPLARDPAGRMFIGDFGNERIRMVTSNAPAQTTRMVMAYVARSGVSAPVKTVFTQNMGAIATLFETNRRLTGCVALAVQIVGVRTRTQLAPWLGVPAADGAVILGGLNRVRAQASC